MAIGLETAAGREAAKAAAEYAQAAALETSEEALLSEATEVQAVAARDDEAAGLLQGEAADMEAKAAAEIAQGEEEQAAGEEKIAQGEAEEALAQEETAQAMAEEESSGMYWKKSFMSGASAFVDAVFASIASFIAWAFFMTRLFFSFLFPSLQSFATLLAKSPSQEMTWRSGDPTGWRRLPRPGHCRGQAR